MAPATCLTADSHLLADNVLNGQVVDAARRGEQLCAQKHRCEPGPIPSWQGNPFGLAMTLDGKGFDDVEDVMNTLVESTR